MKYALISEIALSSSLVKIPPKSIWLDSNPLQHVGIIDVWYMCENVYLHFQNKMSNICVVSTKLSLITKPQQLTVFVFMKWRKLFSWSAYDIYVTEDWKLGKSTSRRKSSQHDLLVIRTYITRKNLHCMFKKFL